MQKAEWKNTCAETYTCIATVSPVDSRMFVQNTSGDVFAFL